MLMNAMIRAAPFFLSQEVAQEMISIAIENAITGIHQPIVNMNGNAADRSNNLHIHLQSDLKDKVVDPNDGAVYEDAKGTHFTGSSWKKNLEYTIAAGRQG